MASLESVPVPVDAFAVRGVGDETILLAEEGEELHTLDEVGTFIWRAIDGVRTLREILGRVCDEYEVSEDVAAQDLLRFADELAQKGIVTLEEEADGNP